LAKREINIRTKKKEQFEA